MSHRFIKTASALIAAVVTLQSAGFAALQREPEFDDLQNHWSKSIIMRLNGYGIINGYKDGTIRPDSYVSVAEFLSIIVKSLGYTADTTDGYWAQPYIDKALELQLID